MKKIALLTVALIIVIIVVEFVFYRSYKSFKSTPINLEGEIVVTVEKGDSWKKVAQRLFTKTVITDQDKFYWMIREKNWGLKLKTGEFVFSGNLTPVDVAGIIVSGKVKMYSFTIPEGYSKYVTAKVVKKLKWIKNNEDFLAVCNSKKFLTSIGYGDKKSCEGLFFPSTYSFPKNTDIRAVMKKMADTLTVVLKKYDKEIKALGMTVYDLLKLASIVEKETGVKKEQPIIASVFFNRMKIGMKMQTDPSVIYGLLPEFKGNLTKKHLMTDHPWNTYTRYGLPITPLCFVGEDAIKSVLYPDKTKYLYFVSVNKGYHYFSNTLKEHNAAVDHYQVKGLKSEFKYR